MYKNVKNIVKKAFCLSLGLVVVLSLVYCKSNPNSTLNHSIKEVSDNSLENLGHIDKVCGSENKDIVVFSTNDSLAAYNDNLTYAGIKHYIDNFDRTNDYVTLIDTGNFF